jgi:hypothetical protein
MASFKYKLLRHSEKDEFDPDLSDWTADIDSVQNLDPSIANKFLILGRWTCYEIEEFISTIGGRLGMLEDANDIIQVGEIIKVYGKILEVMRRMEREVKDVIYVYMRYY